jgi:hypothetical protein
MEQPITGGREPAAPLSADGNWWWDGERWAPALSADGLWRWDGSVWRLVTELDTSDAAALAEGLDRLVDDRFAEAGHLLALRAHQWRPRDPELAELVARAAPLAARLAALDGQLAGLNAGGGALNLRNLLGGSEREQLEAEAREVEAELGPLASLIGRMAPQPSLKEADEILVPARRLAERVLELTQAVAEERRFAAEREAEIREAERRLEDARAARENGLRELEEQVRMRELERASALADLERALRTVRIPLPGAVLARFADVTLYESRVDTPDGRGPLQGAKATVGTAKELWEAERELINRLGLLEAAQARRFHDALAAGGDDESFLLITTPHVRSLVPVSGGSEAEARGFAIELTNAAKEVRRHWAGWESQVKAAEAALQAAIADTAAIDEARAALERAAADPELSRAVEEAEAELKRLSTPGAEHEAARARVEAVAERLLELPTPPVSISRGD